MTPYFQGQDMARRIPEAQLITIDEARHSPQFTHTNQVTAEIESFFSRTD